MILECIVVMSWIYVSTCAIAPQITDMGHNRAVIIALIITSYCLIYDFYKTIGFDNVIF